MKVLKLWNALILSLFLALGFSAQKTAASTLERCVHILQEAKSLELEAEIQILLLLELTHKEMLRTELEKLLGLPEKTIFSAISRMKINDYIVSREMQDTHRQPNGRYLYRHYYRITPAGKDRLHSQLKEYMGRYNLLLASVMAGEMTIGEIAQKSNLSNDLVSSTLTRMLRIGWVTKRTLPKPPEGRPRHASSVLYRLTHTAEAQAKVWAEVSGKLSTLLEERKTKHH